MKSVNKVVLLGNATCIPELNVTREGKSVCTFGIATARVWKDEAGEKQSAAEFHKLVAWGWLAEFCHQHIKKGRPLYVEGYLQTSSWESKDGKKNFCTEIIAEDVVLLGAAPTAE